MKQVRTYAEFNAQGERPEILFWVGCAGSFDMRAQKITKAFVEILERAHVSYAVLGDEESCTGDPARRAGNEFLFQMSALQNIETLNMYGVKKIVTACPHCFNTLKNDYPALGGNYDVLHHTQFIDELLNDNRLKVDLGNEKLTYHDSCYLGRVNGEYEAPRRILHQLSKEVVELKRSKRNGMCCGAGGAQMFKEDEPGNERINVNRAEEVISSGASIVVSNCPFCLTMMEDGIKAKEKQEDVMAFDLAEVIVNNWNQK